MDTTSVRLDNVCQHGFWVGQGAAPCPFCHPECYANGTQGTIAPLITVNLDTIFDSVKTARIAALESALAEREKELTGLIAKLEGEFEECEFARDDAQEQASDLSMKLQSAESALAAAREDYQKQVNHVAAMFKELENLAIEAGWDKDEDLATPMQFIRKYVREGLVPHAGRMKEDMADLRGALAAAREDTKRLDWLLSFASVEDVGDEHFVPGVVFRIEDAESELLGDSLEWSPRQFIDKAIERKATK